VSSPSNATPPTTPVVTTLAAAAVVAAMLAVAVVVAVAAVVAQPRGAARKSRRSSLLRLAPPEIRDRSGHDWWHHGCSLLDGGGLSLLPLAPPEIRDGGTTVAAHWQVAAGLIAAVARAISLLQLNLK
jgi:hypothetical protein